MLTHTHEHTVMADFGQSIIGQSFFGQSVCVLCVVCRVLCFVFCVLCFVFCVQCFVWVLWFWLWLWFWVWVWVLGWCWCWCCGCGCGCGLWCVLLLWLLRLFVVVVGLDYPPLDRLPPNRPPPNRPPLDRPTIHSCFPLPLPFRSFSLSGSFRGNLVVFLKPQMCAFGVLGLSCETPAAQSRRGLTRQQQHQQQQHQHQTPNTEHQTPNTNHQHTQQHQQQQHSTTQHKHGLAHIGQTTNHFPLFLAQHGRAKIGWPKMDWPDQDGQKRIGQSQSLPNTRTHNHTITQSLTLTSLHTYHTYHTPHTRHTTTLPLLPTHTHTHITRSPSPTPALPGSDGSNITVAQLQFVKTFDLCGRGFQRTDRGAHIQAAFCSSSAHQMPEVSGM